MMEIMISKKEKKNADSIICQCKSLLISTQSILLLLQTHSVQSWSESM
jgi:hypothetical protein